MADFNNGLTVTGNLSVTGNITGTITGYQPIDADLSAIAALSGTIGLLKKTAANTWMLDTSALPTGTNTGDETTATIKSKLGISTLSGSNTGDQTTITGNAGTSSRVLGKDLRAIALTPGYFGQGLDLAFMSNTIDSLSDGGTYHGIVQIQPYTDASGGGAYELGFTDNNNIWLRGSSGALTAWSPWKKVWDSGNLTNLNQLTNGPGYTTNLGTVTGVTATAPIVSSGGNTPTISIGPATTSLPGSMSAADKLKLSGVADNANNYTHPANHPASIITQDASNRFVTDAEKTAWNDKQAALVSGTNIKTVNGGSLLGLGDFVLPAATPTVSGTVYGVVDTNNTVIGKDAFVNRTTGWNNAVFGELAAKLLTTGNHNSIFGYDAAEKLTTGVYNVIVGSNAGQRNTTASNNVYVGNSVNAWGTVGYDNTAIGDESYSNGEGNSNVSIGRFSADSLSTGNKNTLIGTYAGSFAASSTKYLSTGSNNILIGYNATATASTVNNEVTIGDANITDFRIPGLGVSWTSSTVPNVNASATQTLTNKTITETVFAVTGTTPALTATNGAVQTWTLSGASTPTDALTTGQSIILVITPGANAITWPSVVWTKQGGSGALPTLFSAGKTMVVLWKVGAVLYGSHLGDTA